MPRVGGVDEHALDAVNVLQEGGLISRRERLYWAVEFNAASNQRLAAFCR